MKNAVIIGLTVVGLAAAAAFLLADPPVPTNTELMSPVIWLDTNATPLTIHVCFHDEASDTCSDTYEVRHIRFVEATENRDAHWQGWVVHNQWGRQRVKAWFVDADDTPSALSNAVTLPAAVPIITLVPEPGSWLLLAAGLLGLTLLYWRYSREAPVEVRRDGAGEEIKWAGRFMELDEIVADLIQKLSSEDDALESWLEITEEKNLLMGHFNVGRYIRNHYGFWFEDHPFADAMHHASANHPDQLSHTVMTRVWRKLKEMYPDEDH
jgi:hypothetical protein